VFLSGTGEGGAMELWRAAADSGKANRLVSIKGFAGQPRWSPDGGRIAFLNVEGAGAGGPAMASGPRNGVIDEAIANQRIAVLNVESGVMEHASPPDRHIYDFDWSPDSRSFVAAAAPGPGDQNWWRAELYVIHAASGEGHPIYKPYYQIGCPRWSPDGTLIAFIEGLMADQSLTGGDLCTIAAGGGKPVNHMTGRATSASSLVWQSPDEVLFTEYTGGGSNLSILNLQSGAIEIRWHGEEEARAAGRQANLSVAEGGAYVAIVRGTFDEPEEVWAGPPVDLRPLTNENADVHPAWGKAESIEFTNEGRRMQAWLLPPSNPGEGPHPLVVEAHGGPSAIAVPMWRGADTVAALAASRYYVLMPNPRGSYGQGQEFTRAVFRDFGYGDLRDIVAAVDAAIERYPIDRQRVGIMGRSYGGFLSMFAVTQCTRFRAAMAAAGIANWASYYGQNLVDHWLVPYFGAIPYDDPEIFARSSPISFVQQVDTPTLILAGEQDAEAPPPQSYEFWQALKKLGVPTELMVHPGEGHALMQTENRRDEARRTLAWFDRYLRADRLY